MNITTEGGVIILEKVYNGITLRTDDGEKLSICMRDSGFEFDYEGKSYRAMEGVLEEVKPPKKKRGSDVGSTDYAHTGTVHVEGGENCTGCKKGCVHCLPF